jgi:DeoR family transcriptional regulator, aga operon transcriptional repressor
VLRHGSSTLTGDALVQATQAIHADVLLCGAHALCDGVITETSSAVAATKRALIKAATHRRLLVDGSKFRPHAFMQVAPITDFEEVITDSAAQADEMARLRDLGLTVTVVNP